MPRISEYPESYGLKDTDRFIVDDMGEDQTLSYTGKQLKEYVNDTRTSSSIMAFAEAIKNPDQYMTVQNEITGLHSKLQMVDMDRYIKGLITGLYRFRGTTTLYDLLNKTGVEVGDVYNVNEKFITTDAFLEGAGQSYDAGSNVVWTDQNKWDVMGGLSIDLSDYATNESVDNKIESALGDYQKITEIEGSFDFNELLTPGIYYSRRINIGDRLNEPVKPDAWTNYTDAGFLGTIIIDVTKFNDRDFIYQSITDLTYSDRVVFSRMKYNNKWTLWKYNQAVHTGINTNGVAGYFEEAFNNDLNKFHYFGEEISKLFYKGLLNGENIDKPKEMFGLVNTWDENISSYLPDQMRHQWCLLITLPRYINGNNITKADWSNNLYQFVIGQRGNFCSRSMTSVGEWGDWSTTGNISIDDEKGMYIHQSSVEGFGTTVSFGNYQLGLFNDKNGTVTLRANNSNGEKILDVGWADYNNPQLIKLPFGFDIDANGNYGYLKQNESTTDRVFVPFGSGGSSVTVEATGVEDETGNQYSGFSMYDNEFIQLDVSGRTVNNKFSLSIEKLGTQTNGVLELPFSFGVDAKGNYGYKKKGADTVIPFKSINIDNASQLYTSLKDIDLQTIDGTAYFSILNVKNVKSKYPKAVLKPIKVNYNGGFYLYNGSASSANLTKYNSSNVPISSITTNYVHGAYYQSSSATTKYRTALLVYEDSSETKLIYAI